MATQQLPQLQVLKHGSRGEAARALQAATNRRLRSRQLDALVCKEDGVVAVRTLDAVRKAAWVLGARMDTCEAITHQREIPIGVQRMIRNPGRRTDAQKRSGKARYSRMLAERKRRAAHPKTGRSRAVNAFLAKVGTHETAGIPNGDGPNGFITNMQKSFGHGNVAWCGIACGYFARNSGGVQGLASDVAGVLAIEHHARNRHSPYGRWQSSPQGALPGSFVVIGGSGTHVGMLVAPLSGGAAKTVEGNTSPTHQGSQSNGGCIAAKVRSASEITGVATMNYPG